MTTKIRPTLDPKFDYRGTLFDDLTVTVFDKADDDFGRLLNEMLDGSPAHHPGSIPASVRKTYRISDRRYNPVHHNWTLDHLIERLEAVLLLGPVKAKEAEKHAAFTIERERPEDSLVKVNFKGICLNEWQFEPLYRLNEYASLSPAVESLKAIQTYLREQRQN